MAAQDGSLPEVKKPAPLLALRFRTAVVPKRVVRALTTVFAPFFLPPVVATALFGFVAVDAWLFLEHGVAQATRELLYNPVLVVVVFGLIVLATALHEIGHAAAARYGGADPGVMGVGVYIVWPAFYTDVTDAYRMSRRDRLRTDLGGVYFNVLFVLGVAGVFALTGFEPLLLLILILHLQMVQQFLPFLRLDGYYILSDLTGVPDLFTRIKPALASALPWRKRDPRVDELKPWVRVVTTAWVVTLVPVLLFLFGTILFNLPRMAATAWDSFLLHADDVTGGSGFEAAAGVIQVAALALPLLGFTYTLSRVSLKLGSTSWRWSEHAPARRALVVGCGVTAAALAGYVLYPNGDYRAIQPGERGTLGGAIRQFADVQTGRPGLTEDRYRELAASSFKSPADARPARQSDPTDPSDKSERRRDRVRDERAPDRPAATEPPDAGGGIGRPAEPAVPTPTVTPVAPPVEAPALPTSPELPTPSVSVPDVTVPGVTEPAPPPLPQPTVPLTTPTLPAPLP